MLLILCCVIMVSKYHLKAVEHRTSQKQVQRPVVIAPVMYLYVASRLRVLRMPGILIEGSE